MADGANCIKLEMHPMDSLNRREQLKGEAGVGFCNHLPNAAQRFAPESDPHHHTDNAIIPLKERVVDDYFDPVRKGLVSLGLIKRSKKAPMDSVPNDVTEK